MIWKTDWASGDDYGDGSGMVRLLTNYAALVTLAQAYPNPSVPWSTTPVTPAAPVQWGWYSAASFNQIENFLTVMGTWLSQNVSPIFLTGWNSGSQTWADLGQAPDWSTINRWESNGQVAENAMQIIIGESVTLVLGTFYAGNYRVVQEFSRGR